MPKVWGIIWNITNCLPVFANPNWVQCHAHAIGALREWFYFTHQKPDYRIRDQTESYKWHLHCPCLHVVIYTDMTRNWHYNYRYISKILTVSSIKSLPRLKTMLQVDCIMLFQFFQSNISLIEVCISMFLFLNAVDIELGDDSLQLVLSQCLNHWHWFYLLLKYVCKIRIEIKKIH